MKDWQNPVIADLALGTAGGIELIKLNKASRHPRKESEKTLRRILEYAKNTVYGKDHRFEDILKAGSAEELFRLFQTTKTFAPMSNDTNTEKPTYSSPASR